MNKTVIYIIRHGESIANLEKRTAGHTDTPLSELGKLQAEATANALADIGRERKIGQNGSVTV